VVHIGRYVALVFREKGERVREIDGPPVLQSCHHRLVAHAQKVVPAHVRDLDGGIGGDVKRLETPDHATKIPHMGWNNLMGVADQPLMAGLRDGQPVYFTHSFAFFPKDERDVAAYVDHGGRFPAAVARGNVAGVQFHPEKSQASGLDLLARFLEWRP
jgi:imidazole glycerol phosphate synthase glutamine amidotransferase subunit